MLLCCLKPSLKHWVCGQCVTHSQHMMTFLVLQAFLEANKLKLILRSHEGPDARWKREGMQDMATGHSLDHDTPGLPFTHSYKGMITCLYHLKG